jgi:hypothetical protein
VTQPGPQPALQPVPIDALRSLFGALSGCLVVWDAEQLPFAGANSSGPGAYVELSLVSYNAVGVDDYRQTYDSVANALQSQMYGYRVFTVSVIVRSFVPQTRPFDLAEQIRWRLRTTSARGVYVPAGLALTTIGSMRVYTEIPNKGDDHVTLWCAQFDVGFAKASCADPLDDPGAIIETVDSATEGVIPVDLT